MNFDELANHINRLLRDHGVDADVCIEGSGLSSRVVIVRTNTGDADERSREAEADRVSLDELAPHADRPAQRITDLKMMEILQGAAPATPADGYRLAYEVVRLRMALRARMDELALEEEKHYETQQTLERVRGEVAERYDGPGGPPVLDSDGYPTEATLRRIREWPLRPNISNSREDLLDFIGAAWHWPKNCVVESNRLELHTGGWSGNESIVKALKASAFGVLWWESSHVGGLHVFSWPFSPKQRETLEDVSKRADGYREMLAAHGITPTCDGCNLRADCEHAYDGYNTNGDCLAAK